jgi:hypothetical protein
MKVLCLLASVFCLIFSLLFFFVEHSVESSTLLAVLALLFASAAISKDGVIRRALLWLFSNIRGS